MQISGLYGMKATMGLPLSDEQQTTLAEILTKYDAENMSAEDKKALREDLAEAGLNRSKAALDMLRDAGFNIGPGNDKAKEDQSPLAGQGTRKGELWDLYQQFRAGEISEDDFLAQIGGQISAGSLFTKIS